MLNYKSKDHLKPISDKKIIDKKRKYCMTKGCNTIVENKNNLEDIKKCLESDKFKEILNAWSWSNYQLDWRLFSYLRKDFYKHFI